MISRTTSSLIWVRLTFLLSRVYIFLNLKFLAEITRKLSHNRYIRSKLNSIDKNWDKNLQKYCSSTIQLMKTAKLMLNHSSQELDFLDVSLMRNLLSIYLINIDKILQPDLKIPYRRYSPIFKFMRILKLEQVLDLVARLDEINIKAVLEVLLNLIFEKYDLFREFDLMKEVKKASEKTVFQS